MKKLFRMFLCMGLSFSVMFSLSVYADKTDSVGISYNSWGAYEMNIDDYIQYASKNNNGNSTIVAVLDTGVDYTHSFLKDRMVYNEDGSIAGYDFVDDDADPMDDNFIEARYHGTHVAGIIADCTQTLDVKILSVRVLDDEGYCEAQDAADGIYYAVDHGADVINMSFYVDYGDRNLVYEAVDYAVAHNVTVVTAAGNDGSDLDPELIDRCPAECENVICVSAMSEDHKLADFSNFGEYIDFTAPGYDILSCEGGGTNDFVYKSGTSMASPHIAALVSMLYLLNSDITPEEVEDQLTASCLDLEDEGYDYFFGWGLPQMDYFVPSSTAAVVQNTRNYSSVPYLFLAGAAAFVALEIKRKK